MRSASSKKRETWQTWKSSAQPLYAKAFLSKPGWYAKKGCPKDLNLKKTAEISYISTPRNIMIVSDGQSMTTIEKILTKLYWEPKLLGTQHINRECSYLTNRKMKKPCEISLL